MTTTIAGKLVDGFGKPIANTQMRALATETSVPIIGATAFTKTDENGNYSFPLEIGNYAFSIWFGSLGYQYVGNIQILEGTPDASLDQILVIPPVAQPMVLTKMLQALLDAESAADAAADEVRANLVPLSKQYMTIEEAQADIANIPVGSTTYIRSTDGFTLAYEVMNVGGTLTPTGRAMDSSWEIFPSSRLSVMETGKNMFNPSRVTQGYYLFEGTGKPRVNALYGYSEYIPVVAGNVYNSNLSTRVVTFYDKDHNYLTDSSSVYNFTVPSNAVYIRVSVLLSYLSTYMLSFGIGGSSFEPFQVVLRPIVDTALVNVYKSMGFVPGKNLFSPSTVNDGVHLSSLGTLYTDTDTTKSVSDYIAIDPTKSYATNQQWQCVAYYDSKGAFISRQQDTSFSSKPIAALVIPANAKYLRLEVPTTNVSMTQVEVGTIASPFEPFQLTSPSSFNNKKVQYGSKSTTVKDLGLFGSGENLFNKNSVTYGWINEYGSVFPVAGSSGTDFVYSDYIKVSEGLIYSASSSMRFVAYYDANKAFMSTIVSQTKVTIPAGVAYMRITIVQTSVANFQLVQDNYLPYRKDFTAMLNSTLPDGTPVKVPGSLIDMESLSIDFVKQGLLVVGKNLFNYRTALPGYINESGVIIPGGTTYYYSEYIAVKPSTTYKLTVGARFIAFYSEKKGFIQTIASSPADITSVTTDPNTYFIRVTIGTARLQTLQVEEGTTTTPFEPFAYSYTDQLKDGTPVAGSGSSSSDKIPDYYGLERLRETHMRLDKMTYGDVIRLTWAMIGDSYTRGQVRYALKCAQKLWNIYQGSDILTTLPPIGYGWRSFGFDPNGDNTDIVGTLVNQSANVTCAYNTGHGPDISSVTMNTGDTISYVQDLTQGFNSYLYAEGGAGVIQYQATGMSTPTVIDLTTYAAGMQIIPMTLPTAGNAATVTWTCNSGPCVLYGSKIAHPTAKGILVHKMGGSGSHSNHWVAAMDARWSTALTDLAPDLVSIMLGTNDQSSRISAATFKSNILYMIDTVRTARPTADIILICPAENNRPGGNTIAISTYADVMYKIARDDRDVAFLNLQSSFGEKAADYAYGSSRPWMVADNIHPDPATGGYAIAASIIRALCLPQK